MFKIFSLLKNLRIKAFFYFFPRILLTDYTLCRLYYNQFVLEKSHGFLSKKVGFMQSNSGAQVGDSKLESLLEDDVLIIGKKE